ncbi:MAG: hypothetical protein NTY60_04790 [Proteobacteria bacterium]|nr:hypothetical protein [Pseudomonadota bacterium]
MILFVFILGADAAEIIGKPLLSSSVSEKMLGDQYEAGEYWAVGSQGLDLLKTQSVNEDLRMKIADSLAWTGRYADAIVQYKILAKTALSDRAAIGLGNVYRWSGRPDLAMTQYQQVLKTQPENPDAVDGKTRVSRELRPATSVVFARNSDSNSVVQNGGEISHRWRADNPALKYELALNLNRLSMPPLNTSQRDVRMSVEHTGLGLAPRLDVSMQQGPTTKVFGTLRLRLDDAPELHMTIGHVNWGKMAFQPQALLNGLTATQLGVDGALITRAGTISAVYNGYQISDGNQIQDANIHFSPSWRPLGPDFRYYIGLSGHFAQRNVPIYWSPQTGYLSTDIGFTNEWSLASGEYSIYGQRGFGVGGEALNSYNMGFAAKRYLNHDWAASMSAGSQVSQRVGAYKSKYLTLGTERLW